MNGKTSAYFHRPEYYLFCRRSSPGSTSQHVAFRAIPLIASREDDEGSSRLFAGTHARRSPMKKTIAICGAFLLAAIIAVAQEKPADTSKDLHPTHTGLDQGAAKPLPMQHEHHGFMQEGMHHAVAKGVTLDAR